MHDHIGISGADFNHSKAFYEPLWAAFSINVIMEFPGEQGGGHAGFGKAGSPFFSIGEGWE